MAVCITPFESLGAVDYVDEAQTDNMIRHSKGT